MYAIITQQDDHYYDEGFNFDFFCSLLVDLKGFNKERSITSLEDLENLGAPGEGRFLEEYFHRNPKEIIEGYFEIEGKIDDYDSFKEYNEPDDIKEFLKETRAFDLANIPECIDISWCKPVYKNMKGDITYRNAGINDYYKFFRTLEEARKAFGNG